MLREGCVGNSGQGINRKGERLTAPGQGCKSRGAGHPLGPRYDYSAQNRHPSGDEEVLPTIHSKVQRLGNLVT